MDEARPFEVTFTGKATKNEKPFVTSTLTYHRCEYADLVDIEEGFAQGFGAFMTAMLAKAKERIGAA